MDPFGLSYFESVTWETSSYTIWGSIACLWRIIIQPYPVDLGKKIDKVYTVHYEDAPNFRQKAMELSSS